MKTGPPPEALPLVFSPSQRRAVRHAGAVDMDGHRQTSKGSMMIDFQPIGSTQHMLTSSLAPQLREFR